jgi:hypothetical protein
MMVKRWNKAATRDLNIKIAAGEINPNTNDAAYIGDVVSGEHFPEYKAPPPARLPNRNYPLSSPDQAYQA